MSSSIKVNYAGLRKGHKKNEGKEPATVIDEQSSQLLLQPNSGSKMPNTAFKQAEGFLDTYNVAFNAGNLDYVNLLIMNQTSVANTKEKSQNGPRRKINSRTKSSVDPPMPIQSKSASPIRMVNKNQGTIPPVHSFEENDKPASMRPDDDDEPQVLHMEEDETPMLRTNDKSGVIYEEDETSRNSRNTPRKEESYGRFFREDGVVRRSMSLEDLRFEKKSFVKENKDHNKSTIHHNDDIRNYSIEKSRDESMQRGSHGERNIISSPKTDFVANLDYYINYFQKTENMSYRKMKAGQYFRGGFAGKSHKSMHKELETANRELRTLKLQIEKMKWKMDGLVTENKMLTKELKAANGRDEENHQMMQKLQEEVLHYKQRSHHYKVKCINMQDVIGQERLEHDNNLRALKKVLANINLALDQRSSPYKHAGKHGNNGLVDSVLIKRDRERMTKSNLREKRHVNDTTYDHYPTILENKNYSRSRENRDNSKRQNSALLSHKMSISSTGEDVEEFSSQLSNSYDYENIYEPQDSNFQDPYNDVYQQEIMKDQQIKFLQGRLAELMSSEEVSFSGQTTGLKSTTKSSRGNKSNHKKQSSTIDLPSYYIGGSGTNPRHERHGSVSRQTNNILQGEQRSRIMKKNYMETPSMHEPTENSFSLHNSD